MQFAVVITTVGVPEILIDYANNARTYGHHHNVHFLVVADKKTPEEAYQPIKRLKQEGFDVHLFTIEQQEKWLQDKPDLAAMIPYNSDNRRNLGYLLAVERGAEVIVSLDDDNFCDEISEDYFQAHACVGKFHETLTTVTNPVKWFNPCVMLSFEPDRPLYARGFPYKYRWKDNPLIYGTRSGRVMINEGLWIEAPDVDAITRLNAPVRSTGLAITQQLTVERGTLCPINSQNTAFHREILPCYYFVVMGYSDQGFILDRFGDIWSGLFAKVVLDAMGDYVTFGKPITIHRRNTHNLFMDLKHEFLGICMCDDMADFLNDLDLQEPSSYIDAYTRLAQQLIRDFPGLERPEQAALKAYLHKVHHNMLTWLKYCEIAMA